jgi:hypothetical protein
VRFGGSARRAHACDMRSEIVVVVCGSTSSTLWHAYRPFAEHTGGGRRSVQSKHAWVSSMSDFIVRLFGATQVGTVRTQHNTTYRRKNGTLIRERTLTGGPAACRERSPTSNQREPSPPISRQCAKRARSVRACAQLQPSLSVARQHSSPARVSICTMPLRSLIV